MWGKIAYRAWAKRLFDIVVGAVCLLLVAPGMIGIALAIRCDTPGPIFFRQVRVGRHGVLFRIFKFRTMQHVQAGQRLARGAVPTDLRTFNCPVPPVGAGLGDRTDLALTIGQDPRITKVGHWLRRAKLDELPQLFDVLRGTMSLVGPRPEVPRYVAHYPADVRVQVLGVRPGITDLASLHFRSENELLARASNPEHEYLTAVLPVKLAYALEYVAHPSLVRDVQILWRTLVVLWWR
jgi:lipopolysaccharide/colanic/teichoic acid biosynthesis glycosyltransferase